MAVIWARPSRTIRQPASKNCASPSTTLPGAAISRQKQRSIFHDAIRALCGAISACFREVSLEPERASTCGQCASCRAGRHAADGGDGAATDGARLATLSARWAVRADYRDLGDYCRVQHCLRPLPLLIGAAPPTRIDEGT